MSIEAAAHYRNEFLKSDFWRDLRIKKFLRDGTACNICGVNSMNNDVHHIYYPSPWTSTTLGDVVVLCRACHTEVHRFRQEKRTDTVSAWGWFIGVRRRVRAKTFPKAKSKTQEPPANDDRKKLKHLIRRMYRVANDADVKHGHGFSRALRRRIEGDDPVFTINTPKVIH